MGHASVVLSQRDIYTLAVSFFRFGVLGDFDYSEDVLGVEEPAEIDGIEIDTGDAVSGNLRSTPAEWQHVQLVFFVISACILLIILMNIFIGVMTTAYTEASINGKEWFLRTRAHYALA